MDKIERIILHKDKYPNKTFIPKDKVYGYVHESDGTRHNYRRGKIIFTVDNNDDICAIGKIDVSKGGNVPIAKSDFYKFIDVK